MATSSSASRRSWAARRASATRSALIMLDIDDFKEFNDTYGHPRGDSVLKTVSNVIRENLREIDVAARYGGEEFVIVLPETDAAGAFAVAERIRESCSRHSFESGEDIPPVHKSVSLGVAGYPEHAQTQTRTHRSCGPGDVCCRSERERTRYELLARVLGTGATE